MAFSAISEFWFIRFRLIFGAPIARLLDSFVILYINLLFVTNNDAFDECTVLNYVASLLRFKQTRCKYK